jgi:CRISPR/Cas system-associated protein Csm6
MALSEKYGKVKVPGVKEDEPVFIIRAQDKLGESAIQMYRLLAEAHGCRVSGELDRVIGDFRRWDGERKMPD